MSSILDEIRKIPIVTRFLCGATLGVSLPVILTITSIHKVVFVKALVTERFELWRPFTSLCFAGTGLEFIFSFAMLYRNSDSLESLHYAGRSADYAWQLLINSCSILALNLPLGSYIHFRPLLLSIITLASYLAPDALVSIFGLITMRNQYFPYALLGLDLLMGGPSVAACSLTGVITGYAWWYLVHNVEAGRPGADFARAPGWVRAIIGDPREVVVPGVGRVVNPLGRPAPAAGPAATTRQGGGHNWGSGNRLGN